MESQRLEVDNYAVHFEEACWTFLNAHLAERQYTKVCLIIDDEISVSVLPIFKKKSGLKAFETIKIFSGEEYKSLDTCAFIWELMLKKGLDRKSLVINLGGGVIGDMGGFCAATFKRGISFIQIPTTLLAMIDASVGGKLGIDFAGLKNTIGMFKNPEGVLIDTEFLKTLSDRQLKSGFAEIVKHALIGQPDHWKNMASAGKKWPELNWEKWVQESVAVKHRFVLEDPFDNAARKVLNFGHTIGHAIESWSLATENPLLHGEAVAHGMRAEVRISEAMGYLQKETADEIVEFLESFFGKWRLPDYRHIKPYMQQDKKNVGGEVRFVLLKGIGNPVWDESVPEEMILQVLARMR